MKAAVYRWSHTGWAKIQGADVSPTLVIALGAGPGSDALWCLEPLFPHAEIIWLRGAACIQDQDIEPFGWNAVALELDSNHALHIQRSDVSELDPHRFFSALSSQDGSAIIFSSAGSDYLHQGLSELSALAADASAGTFRGAVVNEVGILDRGRIISLATLAISHPGLSFGYGADGGWLPFGPRRRVTAAEGMWVYELDGQPALDLYRRYLGEEADQLPYIACHFPMYVHSKQKQGGVVRSVVEVDETTHALGFRGPIERGSHVSLMRAGFNRLIDGAAEAAREAASQLPDPEVALVFSGSGRLRVMGQEAVEELETVRSILGDRVLQIGLYDEGEIAGSSNNQICLQNENMSVLVLGERRAA